MSGRGAIGMNFQNALEMSLKIAVMFLSAAILSSCSDAQNDGAVKEIKIGALYDATGPTSDTGWHYVDGLRDYFRHLNEEMGGVADGVKINFMGTDYQYKIPLALTAYSKFVKQDNVSAIIGWGTGDSEALKGKIVQDQIPYLSVSLSQHLVWPPKWNFIPVTTYADHVRTVMKYFKDNWTENRDPRMALIYNDSSYGRAPVEAAEKYAPVIGIDLVGKEIVGLQDLEATSQLLRIKEARADFVFIQETFTATATVLKDAKKLDMGNVTFFGNIYGTGQKVVELAGEAAEGYFGVMAFPLWDEEGEGVAFARELNAKYHPDVNYREPQYITGVVNAMIMQRAIEIALEANGGDPQKVSGPEIRKGMQNISDFDPMGLTTRINYSANDHRGAKGVKLVTIKNGKLAPHTDWLETPEVPEAEIRGEQ